MKTATAKLCLVFFLALPAGMALAQDGARPPADRPGSREWVWDGGDTLAVGGSLIVRVRKDGPPRVVMTGPEDQLERAYLRRGHIGVENDSSNWRDWSGRRPLEVTISGVSLADVTSSGSSQVTLGSLQQPVLHVRTSGSSSVNAGGRVDELNVRVSGSGHARLDGMTARRGDLSVSGSGHVDVAAVEDGQVNISGSGQVRINERPRNLSQSISGSGRLVAGGEFFTRRRRR